MSKNKKKRNKTYTGEDASISRPVVTHISAANRSRFGQWWFEHKELVFRIGKIVLVAIVIIAIVVEIINICSGKSL